MPRKKLTGKNAFVKTILTTSDVCTLYKVSPTTVYRWRTIMGAPWFTVESDNLDCIRFNRIELAFWAAQRGLSTHSQDHVSDTD